MWFYGGPTDIAIFYAMAKHFPRFWENSPRKVPLWVPPSVFDSNLNGRKLTFKYRNGAIVDEQTGSEWNIFGEATDGPLAGSALSPVVHANHFWFAWSAFSPDTAIKRPDEFTD